MSSPDAKPLVIGRVKGSRGPRGEVTVTVASGDAARWAHLDRVVVEGAGSGGISGAVKVESARAYRDRLVLKLAGVDDANQAAALRGSSLAAFAEDVPELPDDVYWVERLVGARVMDSALGDIGRVTDVVVTGGVDLLVVKDDGGAETLVPLARRFVDEIDEAGGTIRVALPEGLRGLNEDERRGTA